MTNTLQQKSQVLNRTLSQLGSALVAYSGGTDSAFLAWATYRALGDNMLAVIADSASLPRAELSDALDFTKAHRIPTYILHTDEVDNADYQRNDARRCFHCKDELFSRMEKERVRLAYRHIAFGMNVDDQGDFRPGQQAAAQHRAVAPLVTAELTKAEIRTLARGAGLSIAEKPAAACLASRIEYGRPVTRQNLSQVEHAEAILHELGFHQVRVRHHGDLARIEIDRADLPRALSMSILDQITEPIKALGFDYVTLDLQGYRSGSMNDVLTASDILAASR